MNCNIKLEEKYYKKYMKYKQKYIEITKKKSVSDRDYFKIKMLVKSREWKEILRTMENLSNLKNDINNNNVESQHIKKMNFLIQNALKLTKLFKLIKQKYQFSNLEMFTLTDMYKENLNPKPLFNKTAEFKLNNLLSSTEDKIELSEGPSSSCGKSFLLKQEEDDDLSVKDHKHEIKDINNLIDFLSKTESEKEIEVVTDKNTAPDSKEMAPDNKDLVPDSKEMVPNNRDFVPDNKEMVPDNRDFFPDSKEMFPDSKKMVPDNRDLIPDSKEMVPDNKDLIPDSKEIAPNDKLLVPDNESVNKDKNFVNQLLKN